MNTFTWTDDAVKAFARIYCGGSYAGIDCSDYQKLKMDEKVELFKAQWSELYPSDESATLESTGRSITITINI